MRLLGFILAITLYCQANGQTIKLLNNLSSIEARANTLYANKNYEEAAKLYERAFSKDTTQVSLALGAADCYYHINHYTKAEEWYRIGLAQVLPSSPDELLKYAQVLIANKKYDEAKKWLLLYRDQAENDLVAEKKLKSISNIGMHYADSGSVIVDYLNINTDYAEFSPTYYRNGIVFLSDHHSSDITNVMGWSDQEYVSIFFTKEREGGNMSDPIEFHSGLDASYHEGPLVLYDQNKIIYTRAGVPNRNSDESHLELHYAEFDDKRDQWVNRKPLPFNSTTYSVGHPTINKSGELLIFTSNMPGGYGGTDLYYAKKTDDGWGQPVNLGPFINSKGEDMFPYLVHDNELIFASDGHGGLGDLDLFRAPLNVQSHDEVENLGYPFNTSYADFGFISDPQGRSGYFTSNRKNGGLDDDIYRFRVLWSRVQVEIFEKGENKPLLNAKVEMLVNESIKDSKFTDSLGTASMLVLPGEEVVLQASLDGYTPETLFISSDDLYAGRSITVQLALEKIPPPVQQQVDPMEELAQLYNRKKAMIQVGGRVYEYREIGNNRFIVNADEKIFLSNEALNLDESLEERAKKAVEAKGLEMQEVYMVKNIYFDLDSNELTASAKEELNKVVKIMTVDKKIAFAINSYTDSRGSMAYNDELAFKRSQMIARYLLENDIPGSRLILDSYGEQGILNHCDDTSECEEVFHAVNRRSEMELVMRKLYQ